MMLHVLVAQAPDDDGTSPLVLLVLALLGLYLLACAIWPYTGCRSCSGKGRFTSPSGRSWRNCGRCGGSGRRTRFGRRIWNTLGRGTRTGG